DLSDHRQERILNDLLGILGVAGDPDGQPVDPVLVGRDETLGGARLPVTQGFHEPLVTVSRYDVQCPSAHRGLLHRFAPTHHWLSSSAVIQLRTYSGQLTISVPVASAAARNRTAARSTSVTSFRSRTTSPSASRASSASSRAARSVSRTPLRANTIVPGCVERWIL